jgi:head-tail adaptor
MVRAGTFRDRIRIEQYVAATDAVGGAVKEWAEVATVNCQIAEISSRVYERTGGGSETGEGSTRIKLREVPGFSIDPNMRCIDIDRGDEYDIVSVSPSRTRGEYTLLAKHGGPRRS